jgi:hypothetical protein
MSKTQRWSHLTKAQKVTLVGIILGMLLLTSGISSLYSLLVSPSGGLSVLLFSSLLKISIGLLAFAMSSLFGTRTMIDDLEKRITLLEKPKESL